MLVLRVQEWAALGPQSMPTNNLSLTLGPGREEGEEEDGEEEEEGEEETESTRTKCPAQGRERKRWAIEGTERWRDEEYREIRTQRKTLSAPDHLEEPHSTFFSGKQPLKIKFCREHKTYNSFYHNTLYIC